MRILKALLRPESIIVASGITASLHLGKLAPAIVTLQNELHMSLVHSGLLLSLVQFIGMISGVFWGAAVGKIGLKKSIYFGLFILTLSSAMGGMSTSVVSLFFLRATEGLGFVLVVLSGPGLIQALVTSERLNNTIGWWSAFMGLGTGFALLFGTQITEVFGWRIWWWVTSLCTAIVLCSVKFIIPKDLESEITPDQSRQFFVHIFERLQFVFKDRTSWLLAIIFASAAGQWLAIIGFLPSLYVTAEISVIWIGILTALVALASSIGTVLGGKLLDRGGNPETLLMISFSFSALMTWVSYVEYFRNFFALQYLAIFLFSAIAGIIPTVLFSLSINRSPSPELVSTTLGWMQQISALGQVITPPLFAMLAVAVGGWHYSWVITDIMSLVGIILSIMLYRTAKQ